MSEFKLPARRRITRAIASYDLWVLPCALFVGLALLRSGLVGMVAVGFFVLMLIVMKPQTGLFLFLVTMPFQRTAFRHLPSWTFGFFGLATVLAIIFREVRLACSSFSRRGHPLEWLPVAMWHCSFVSLARVRLRRQPS